MNMKMMRLLTMGAVALGFTLIAALPSLACDAMGPNRHVGVVTAIDPQAGSFTIVDAQTREPISFTAQEEILNTLRLNSRFIVTFKEEGDKIEAEDVEPAS